jgi:hypothetical protein
MTDYTSCHILIPIITGDIKTYASVNAVMYDEEDELESEGTYFIYLLHPIKGSTDFTLEYDYTLNRWVSRDALPWVSEEIMDIIIDKLPAKQ